MNEINEVQAMLQAQARQAWIDAGKRGTVAAGTGAGKTKIAIDEVYNVYMSCKHTPNVLLFVPTENLRDTNWPEEFSKWYPDVPLMEIVQAECYASMTKVRSTDETWDLVIFDEAHHLTAANTTPFFQNNTCKAIMGLTATPPRFSSDPYKYELLEQYCPVVFSYSLDQGVEDGVIADFQITVITQPLDAVNKVIPAGNKKKPFMQTEVAAYEYIGKTLKAAYATEVDQFPTAKNTPVVIDKKLKQKQERIRALIFKQMHFIYNLPSKTKMAFNVIVKLLTAANIGVPSIKNCPRTLVFCGSIAQCEKLMAPYTWHSKNKKGKPTKVNPVPEDMMDRLQRGDINAAGVVDSANEGINIPGMEQAIAVQCKASEREMVQRLGRIVRFREGHKGQFYILCAIGTQDESWVRKSLARIDAKRVRWITYQQFMKE